MLGHSWKEPLGLCFLDRPFALKAEKLPQIEGSVAAVTSSEAGVGAIVEWGGLRGSIFDSRQLCRWSISAGRGTLFL
ncbi:hypothetical protein HMPREF2787_08440 [Corynebacterium sp. HMSC061H03]|nr:hypothetical protein [Corynebacterium sp. LK25]ODQ43205.1 hypothetical protein BGC22_09920 [Corynebacterium amycolatum]OFL12680.1 hypothetical protein HMPREF2788_03605 [Corynebacterium sp. HMSC063F04]OHR25780.1 hypothetical protein HMPREF2787_08440 [Corynebacterium sp. HMSC061H03]TXS84888.1 hypothetical protein CHU70_03380 [Corynebacterium sp. LK10]